MSSKRYPEEFKIEAVKQVTEKGYSVAEVAGPLEPFAIRDGRLITAQQQHSSFLASKLVIDALNENNE